MRSPPIRRSNEPPSDSGHHGRRRPHGTASDVACRRTCRASGSTTPASVTPATRTTASRTRPPPTSGHPTTCVAVRDEARRARTGRYDCLHLLSGGKDSTYALLPARRHGLRGPHDDARQRLHLGGCQGQCPAIGGRPRGRPRVRDERRHERDLPRLARAPLQRVPRLLQDDVHAGYDASRRTRDPGDRHGALPRPAVRDPARTAAVRCRPVSIPTRSTGRSSLPAVRTTGSTTDRTAYSTPRSSSPTTCSIALPTSTSTGTSTSNWRRCSRSSIAAHRGSGLPTPDGRPTASSTRQVSTRT